MNAVRSWFSQSFQLLEPTKSRWLLVIFCGVFSFLFLNIFEPFQISNWFEGIDVSLFIIVTFFSVAGMAALIFTQFAIRSLFRINLTTRARFFFWLLFEFFFLSIVMHVANHIITKHPLTDVVEYFQTLKHTLFVVMLPYSIAVLLLYVQEQLQVVEELTLKVNRPVVTENVNINDENGKVVLSLASKNILYFKSEDNYTLLHYTLDDHLKKELIRTTLKKLEQELGQPNFIRIHRSYMINSQNLISAAKTSRGYEVKMELASETALPVSATYQRDFEDRLIQKK
jgi:DNA-binding LytR/AlgR family response regulator